MIKAHLIWLLASVSALHIAHQQTDNKYNAPNYLNDLQTRQSQFQSDIQNIKQQIATLNQTLSNSTLTSSQRLTTLTQGMADERDSLYNIQTYLDLPFEIEPCYPVNLTADQRNQLQQQIDSVNNSLNNLSSQVNFCPECPQVEQIKAQIKKNYNYLQVIEATVHSGCLTRPYQFLGQNATGLVNLANSLYKDNLKATNWIYGNMTEQDYRLKMFSLSTQYNLTSCPIQTPYVDMTQKACIACFGVYNLGERVCYPCQNNTHYDTITAKCVSNPPTCAAGTQYNATSQKCENIVCGPGLRINLTTNQCVPMCSSSQYFDFNSQTCVDTNVTCNPGYFYNVTTKKCEIIVCPQGQIYDTLSQQCIDQNKNTVSMCPPDRPYWNSTAIKCQVCPPNYPFYNKLFNRCEACPANTVYDSVTATCKGQAQCPPNQIFNQTTQQCQTVQPNCPNNTYWDTSKSQCVCNAGFTQVGNTCVIINQNTTCPPNYHYNLATNMCQTCGAGLVYNVTLAKCEKIVCTGGYLNTVTQKCEACPAGSYPVASGLTCVTCAAGSFYDPTQQGCAQCPAGTFYDSVSSSCHQCPAGTTYNPATKLCDTTGCPSGSYYSMIEKKCKTQPSCPANQYFSLQTEACTSYPVCGANQILNVATKQCQPLPPCPSGQYYSKVFNGCVNATYATSPNSTNLLYAYPFSQYIQEYQSRKVSDPNLRDCPLGTPYYDRNNKVCVSCPASNPYFNLNNNLCQNCGSLTYEAINKTCTATPVSINPTLERLIMNIL